MDTNLPEVTGFAQDDGRELPELEALRPHHRAFVLAYCGIQAVSMKWNATEAARAAGYTDTPHIGKTAHEVLNRPDVRAAVDAILEERRRRYAELLDRAVDELSIIAFSKVTDLVDVRDTRVTAKDNLDRRASARAISEIRETQTPGGGSAISVKMHSKTQALGLLAKITGGIVERHAGPDGRSPVTAQQVVQIYIPDNGRTPLPEGTVRQLDEGDEK